MKWNSKSLSLTIILLIAITLSSCVSFWKEIASTNYSDSPSPSRASVIETTYSQDPYKDEIIRVFAFNGIKIKESSIKRVSNWAYGLRFEVPVQNGVAIVYFDGDELIAMRDKSDLHYIYGGPTSY